MTKSDAEQVEPMKLIFNYNNVFYSFYYDSWQSVEAYRDILEQVPAEFAKPAAAVLELL